MFAYAGKILRVDLSNKKVRIEKLPEEFAQNYIGGNGFAARTLWNEIEKGIDPLGPRNKLIFSVGPITGTIYPRTGRYEVSAKSPLTNGYGEANSGGFFGPEMKYAGFDMFIFEGVSESPVYVYVNNGKAEIRDATNLWGKTTWETEEEIRRELENEMVRIASIGPAGENLVRFSAVITNKYDAAARTGLGAVMGSKKLKAVAVYGTADVKVHDPEKFFEFSKEVYNRLLSDPFSKSHIEYGTRILIELMNEIGRLPTKNFQMGVFKNAHKIGGEVIKRKYKVRNMACCFCPFRCKDYTKVPTGKYKNEGSGPEYETLCSLGSKLLHDNLEVIMYLGQLCNQYGLDTISTGGVIGFIMELYERGILTKSHTGGVELKWGDSDIIVKLVEKIAHGETFDKTLIEGTQKFAKKMGKEAEKYAMIVKGMDISAQDGRAQKSMGLSHVTANRGADHLTSYEVMSEVGFPEAIEKRFGKHVMPEAADRLDPKYKPLMVRDCENFCAISDSLIECKFGAIWPPIIYFEDNAKTLNYATGWSYSEKDLRRIGERIFVLERAFILREGFTSKDDRLPERFTKEPAPVGPNKGHVVEIDDMLREYYRLRDWDERGYPSYQKMEELDLLDVASELGIEK